MQCKTVFHPVYVQSHEKEGKTRIVDSDEQVTTEVPGVTVSHLFREAVRKM